MNPGVWPCGCALQRPIWYSQTPVSVLSWPSRSHQQPAWQDNRSPKSLPVSHSEEESPESRTDNTYHHTQDRKKDASQSQPRRFPQPRWAAPARRQKTMSLWQRTDPFRLLRNGPGLQPPPRAFLWIPVDEPLHLSERCLSSDHAKGQPQRSGLSRFAARARSASERRGM